VASILGDLWQVVDNQRYLGEELMNVFYYRVTSVTGIMDAGYDSFLDWFETDVVEVMADLQSTDLNHYQISVRNISNNIDFREKAIDVDGLATGGASSMPSYVTLTYKLIRESLVTRNGAKRIAGVSESQVTGNTWTAAGSAADIALAAALATDWVDGVITMAEPVIVKRPINPPVGTTYEYSSIGDAQFTRIGTQNTRKA
jgi:hypothetical protein